MIKDPKNFPKTEEDAFQRVCDETYAYMAPTVYVASFIKTAKCVVVPLPTHYFETSFAIALSNDSEYKNLFNHK
jgi:hypothetical protein